MKCWLTWTIKHRRTDRQTDRAEPRRKQKNVDARTSPNQLKFHSGNRNIYLFLGAKKLIKIKV